MSVWSPKKSSSIVFEPKVDSSTPMRDSLSMPGMSWQPAQPYLRTSVSPSAIVSGVGERAPSAPSAPAAASPSVSRYDVTPRASSSVRRRLGMRATGE